MTGYTTIYDSQTGKLTGVMRTTDGAWIPKDGSNRDWLEFLSLNALDPLPLSLSDGPVPVPLTQDQIDALDPEKRDLRASAAAALAANDAFLALANPTTQQVLLQVKRLTTECSAVIKRLVQI